MNVNAPASPTTSSVVQAALKNNAPAPAQKQIHQIHQKPGSSSFPTSNPLALVIFAAREAMKAGPQKDITINFFAKIAEFLITGENIANDKLSVIQKIITECESSSQADSITLSDFIEGFSNNVQDFDTCKQYLEEKLTSLKKENLQMLKDRIMLTSSVLQANPAVLLIKVLNPKEFAAMGNAIKELIEQKDYKGSYDPRSSEQDFADFSQRFAGIVQTARNIQAMNPKASTVNFYIEEMLKLGLSKDVLVEMYQEMSTHSQKTPEKQAESIDFVSSLVAKLKESLPYALVPTLVSFCTSMVSWIPVIGQPIAQLAGSITSPLTSIFVAQMASSANKKSSGDSPATKGSVA